MIKKSIFKKNIINHNKTKYIILNRREINFRKYEIMKVENHSFKRVFHFNYLGSILTNDKDTEKEIDNRLKKCYYGLGKLLSAKDISKNLKIQIYMTLIRPVVLYSSVTWPLRKGEQIMLEGFERKMINLGNGGNGIIKNSMIFSSILALQKKFLLEDWNG